MPPNEEVLFAVVVFDLALCALYSLYSRIRSLSSAFATTPGLTGYDWARLAQSGLTAVDCARVC